MDLSRLRNIGVAAHIDAGKTTLTERLLFYTGRIHRAGDVDAGTTRTDYRPDEQLRGITITSAAVTMSWKRFGAEHTINLIDTPGHVDFTIEVERSLRVLDGAVAVFSAVEGVQAQSETVWKQMNKYGVPRLVFVNKMDRTGADFERTVAAIARRLPEAAAVPLQIPVGAGEGFCGVVDLITMKARIFSGSERDTRYEEVDCPPELRGPAERARALLVEKAAELDDALMEKYLSEQPIDQTELRAALRKGTIAHKCRPVLCGSAFKYRGVQALLDAVCDYLPSPLDRPPEKGVDMKNRSREVVCRADPKEPLAAVAFKILTAKTGDLTFLRLYSGTLKGNTRVLNSTRDRKENISRLLRMFADEPQNIEQAEAGDIAAVVGLKDTLTGDTLCDPRRPVLLGRIDFPETVISKSIEPQSSADKDKLSAALTAVSREDPTFKWSVNPETGEVIIRGMGELHLEIITDRLAAPPPFGQGLAVRVGRPKVSYRETVTGTARTEGRFIRQTGGRGHYAVVDLRVEPYTPAKGEDPVVFVDAVRQGAISRPFIAAVEQGVREGARTGVLAGYPVINVKATLLDGRMHEVDSSELAFEQAGYLAFNEAAQKAGLVLLEPHMRLEVTTPAQYLGAVQGDLLRRGAEIVEVESRDDLRVITATAPMSRLFGYETDLRSVSQGRASSAMEFARYAIAAEQPNL